MDEPNVAQPRFAVDDVRSRVAVAAARAVSRGARLWRQRGLGTIFLKLHALPGFHSAECTVEFEPGSRFRLPVFEPYWGPTIVGGRPYEPEVVHTLLAFHDLAPTLIDCGANWGYYSVLATSPRFGYVGGVAIEANPTTFARLRENARVNSDRFVCLPFAVAETSGKRVSLASAEHHAIAQVDVHGSGTGKRVDVETISLDDAVERSGFSARDRFVIKVDVEGQEIAAISGARRLRETKDHAFVYEDWASTEFETTAHLMNQGYPVFYVRTDGRAQAVPNLAATRGILAQDGRISRPCNLVAVKSGGAFHQRLLQWQRA